MTASEWATLFVLKFGARQSLNGSQLPGEQELIDAMCKDLQVHLSEAWRLLDQELVHRGALTVKELNYNPDIETAEYMT